MSTVSEEMLRETRMKAAAARANTPVSDMVIATEGETIDTISRRGLVLPSIKDDYGRFIIREFNWEDAPRVRELNEDVFFAPLRHIYGPYGLVQAALRQQRQGKERSNYFLAIADTQTKEVIGSVMLFDFKKNKRIATDASVRMLNRLGLALGIKNLVATVHPENKFSRRILAKLGFKESSKVFTSKYKEDPSKPESYEVIKVNEGKKSEQSHRILKYAPRLRHAVTFSHFSQQQDKIVTTDSDIRKIEEARIERARIKEARRKVSADLKRVRPLPEPKVAGRSTPAP
jgi:Acetyltransferase (GNAT) domain